MCQMRACLGIRSATACCSAPTRCVSRPEALALALATHLDHPVDDCVRDAKLKVIAESFRDWGRDCWRPRWDFGTSLALTVGCYRSVHEGASPLDCCLADLGPIRTCLSQLSWARLKLVAQQRPQLFGDPDARPIPAISI